MLIAQTRVAWHAADRKGGRAAGFADLFWADLECADPTVLAEFYPQVLAWDVTDSQDEYAVISNGPTPADLAAFGALSMAGRSG
jgi:hypothetical protein